MAEAHVCTDFQFNLNIVNFDDSNIRFLEISGTCPHCQKRLMFRGRFGINPGFPTVAVGGAEAMLPFMLEGETYDGKMAGYEVTAKGAN